MRWIEVVFQVEEIVTRWLSYFCIVVTKYRRKQLEEIFILARGVRGFRLCTLLASWSWIEIIAQQKDIWVSEDSS